MQWKVNLYEIFRAISGKMFWGQKYINHGTALVARLFWKNCSLLLSFGSLDNRGFQNPIKTAVQRRDQCYKNVQLGKPVVIATGAIMKILMED